MSRFHVPGHKGRAKMLGRLYTASEYDVTELPDTGSLFDGEGATAEAERRASRLFGTAGTFFSAGGCTLCIQAMIRLAVGRGGKILMSRNIHKSAVNTLALLDITPVWVYPSQNAGVGLAGRIEAQSVEDALKDNGDVGAVYLTSPDYYGVISDIFGISQVCRRHGIPLIVDNAHGAHLWFTEEKLHPVQQGADMSACSAHKTLPVLTGGAFLNIANEKYVPYARNAMALFGSTSPSFLTLMSLDMCCGYLEDSGERDFKFLRNEVDEVKRIAARKGIGMPQGLTDPVRIALRVSDIGWSGPEFSVYLRKKGVEVEYTDSAFVVLVPSPFNGKRDFCRLKSAIENAGVRDGIEIKKADPERCEMVLRPSEAALADSYVVDIEHAEGKIAAKTCCPCPPGIPVVMPGERITSESIGLLKNYGVSEIEIVRDYEI